MKIPKIIHQVWEGRTEKNMPKRLKILSESWTEINPSWKYHLWTDEEMNDLVSTSFPFFKDTYDNFQYDVQRWDSIRYMILFQYGGFYADLDTECLMPIDNLLKRKVCCFGEEPIEHSKFFLKDLLIGNAIMGSVPKQKIFLLFLAEIIKSLNDYASNVVLNTTGPLMITRIINNTNEYVEIISSKDVSPLTKGDVVEIFKNGLSLGISEKLEKAYCVHYFFGSWDKKFSIFD